MKTRLSPEAAHAKYEYNKKSQNQYWERKATQQKQEEPDGHVSVSRNKRTDADYIKALEASNRVLNSENRRLVNLIQDYRNKVLQSLNVAI